MRELRELWHDVDCPLLGVSDFMILRRCACDTHLVLDCCGALVQGRRIVEREPQDLLIDPVSPVDARATPTETVNIAHPVLLALRVMPAQMARDTEWLLLRLAKLRREGDPVTEAPIDELFAYIDAWVGRQHLTEHLSNGDDLYRQALIEKELPR